MPNQNMPEHNGHRASRRRDVAPPSRDWQTTARDAFGALSNIDVPTVIRKNPAPAIAIAGAAGFLLGVTLGSRMVRMIASSVGMYAVGEFAKKYARRAFEEMNEGYEDEPLEVD